MTALGLFDDVADEHATAPTASSTDLFHDIPSDNRRIGRGGLFDDVPTEDRKPNYDEKSIRAAGASKRSEGVNHDGSIPGYAGTLDRAHAGDNWTTIGVQQDGLNLTYVVPTRPGDKPGDAFERFKKNPKETYGAFETDQAGEEAMRSASRPSMWRRVGESIAGGDQAPSIFGDAVSNAARIDQNAAPDRDTWLDVGVKALKRIIPNAEQFVGGYLEKMGDHPEPNPSAMVLPDELEWLAPGSAQTAKDLRAAASQPGGPIAIGRKIYQNAQADLTANAPNVEQGGLKYYAGQVADSVFQMLPGIVASLGTKSTAPALLSIGAQMGGQEYGQSIEAGRTPEAATADAVFYAAAETIPEEIPLEVLMKPGGAFLPRLMKVAGLEGLQEMFTQVLETGYDAGVIGKDMTWGDALSQVKDAGIVGAMAGGLFATGAHVIHGGGPPAKPPGPIEDEQTRRGMGMLTDQDRASPLPDALIAKGKAMMADAAGAVPGLQPGNVGIPQNPLTPPGGNPDLIKSPERNAAHAAANEILQRNSWPAVGTAVTITNESGKPQTGRVMDAFTTKSGELNTTDDGIRIKLDDGKVFEAFKSELEAAKTMVVPTASAEAAGAGVRVGSATGAAGVAPGAPGPETAEPGAKYANPMQGGGLFDDLAGEATGDGTRANPIDVTHPDHLVAAGANVNQTPTDAQKEAGNYAKAHITLQGLPITLENTKGGERTGETEHGGTWRVTMPADYGYIKRTVGADNEQVDVYVGPEPQSQHVFVVNQKELTTGMFDEHKVMLGFPSLEAARATYIKGFSDGKGEQRIGSIAEMDMGQFKARLATGEFDKPMSGDASRGLFEDVDLESADDLDSAPHQTLQHYAEQLGITTKGRFRKDVIADLRKMGARAEQGGSIIHIPATPEEVPDRLGLINPKLMSEQDLEQLRTVLRENPQILDSRGHRHGWIYRVKGDGGAYITFAGYGKRMLVTGGTVDGTRSYGGEMPRALMNTVLKQIFAKYPLGAHRRPIGAKEEHEAAKLAAAVEAENALKAKMEAMKNVQPPGNVPGRGELAAPGPERRGAVRSGEENRGRRESGPAAGQAAPEAAARGGSGEGQPGAPSSGGESVRGTVEQRAEFRHALNVDHIASFGGKTYDIRNVTIAGRNGFVLEVTEGKTKVTRGGVAHQGLWSHGRAVQEAFEEAFPFGLATVEAKPAPSAHGPHSKAAALEKFDREFAATQAKAKSSPAPGELAPTVKAPDRGASALSTAAAAVAKPGYGEKNTLVSKDRAEELRVRLRNKLKNQANVGIDPEVLAIGAELATFHIEAGARRFVDLAHAIAADLELTVDRVRPYLRAWYNGARDMMEDAGHDIAGMDSAEDVKAALAQIGETGGLQDTVPAGDEGSGAGDVQRASQERPARKPSGGKVEGSSRDVPTTDEERAQAAERGSEGLGSEPGGRGAGASNANRVSGKRKSGTDGRDPGLVGENYSIPLGALDEARGPKQKARDNIRAFELMREIETEGRPATHEEQAELARYVGWGGIKGAFPDASGNFGEGLKEIGQRLREMLSQTEYRTAQRSIQYAHYTSETIVRAMWDAAARFGFKGGSVFEPGMGVGNFAGMMPPDIAAATQYHGLELDHATARIARLIYPRWGVRRDDFTKAPLPENTYDLVIGNPPFADVSVRSDPKYKQGFLLHDYFFAKSIDAVRPGGLMMFISSAGTMNKVDSKAREYLAERAELVGAIRLPSDAFAKNAGTEVTTDIIILRKRLDGEAPGSTAWTETKEVSLRNKEGGQTKGAVSAYFQAHPENVLGEQGFFDKLYPGRYAVHARQGVDMGAAIKAAFERMPRDVMQDWADVAGAGETDFDTTERKEGSFYFKGTTLMQMRGGNGTPVQLRGREIENGRTAPEIERIKALIPVRDALRSVYAADLAGDVANGDKARARLNEHYDAFVKRFGPINKAEFQYRRPNVIQQESARAEAREEARFIGETWDEGTFDVQPLLERHAKVQEIARARANARDAAKEAGTVWSEGTFDPSEMADIVIDKRPNIDPFADDQESYRLRSIEKYNDDTGAALKGRVFFENVISKDKAPEINSVNDALLSVLNKLGRPDIPAIAAAMKISEESALEQLGDSVFLTPGTQNSYETRELYLSGNVRQKLRDARAAAEKNPAFRRNAAALEGVQPPPLPPAEIKAVLGMPWIPSSDIEEFGKSLGLKAVKVKYETKFAQWFVKGESSSAAASTQWGTDQRSAPLLIQDALNRTDPKIYDTVIDSDGSKRQVLNAVQTQAAQDKVKSIKARFADWLWEDTARADRLVGYYNENFNNLVVPIHDGSYLTTPGIASTWSWRPHQKAVIARIIQSGSTYVAHAVGAGKTSEMIGSAMEMRRLGLVRKPMFAVPNHMLGQFTKEFYEQYPTARIAVADERQFHTDRRKQFVSDIATSDLDAVIITHSAFGKIAISDEFSDGLIQEQLDQYRSMLSELEKNDPETRILRGKLEAAIEKFEQRLEGRKGRADQVFTFEETGVDFLFVDEAHLFRKLDFATKLSNLKGVDPDGSKMAWDLYVKTRYLETVNPGRNLVLASGTPVTNTMAELYTISRYIQPKALAERGLSHFDAWASAFGDTASDWEQNAAGGYKSVARFAEFVNVPELSAMVRLSMDVVTFAQLEKYVTLPKLKGGKRQMHLAEKSPELEAYQRSLAARMRAIEQRTGKPKKGDDIMLTIINDGRHAAIDMRLVNPSLPNFKGSKLNLLVDNVFRIWQETARQPFHRPGKDGYDKQAFEHGPATQMIFTNLGINNARAFSTNKFIVAELVRRGVPRNEIAQIADYKGHVQKQRLFNDMNEGRIRVLIGSTAKMATGVNAQRRLYAVHDLDPLWFPSDDEQRNGRAKRQGNLNPEIEIHDYSTKGTYDSTMWGMMARKGRFIEAFFRGDPNMRTMEDLGEASQYEQAKAITTNDPRMIELAQLKADLDTARRRRAAFESEQYQVKNRLEDANYKIKYADGYIAGVRKDIAQRVATKGDEFKATVDGKPFDKRVDAGEALVARTAELKETGIPQKVKVAKIGGFTVQVEIHEGGTKKERYYYATTAVLRNGGLTDVRGDSPLGLVRSIESVLQGFEGDIVDAEQLIQTAKRTIADYTPKLDATFEGGAEIGKLAGRVFEIESAMRSEAQAAQAKAAAGAAVAEEEKPAHARRPAQVDTPQFKAWFGNSKVVDGDGKPLAVYHGTDADVSRFKPSEGWYGHGIYFSDNPAYASEFAEEAPEDGVTGANVLPVYLQLRRPFVFREKLNDTASNVQLMHELGFNDAAINRSFRDEKDLIRPALERMGHDGLLVLSAEGRNEYVVFRPEQVKSATGNTGAFNPDDQRITHARRPEIGGGGTSARVEQLRSGERLYFTPKMAAAREALAARMRERLDALGLAKVAVRVADAIRTYDGQGSEGFYLNRAITLALDSADPLSVLDHEVIHALKRMGLFTETEWRILEAEAKAKWLDQYADKLADYPESERVEESVAFAAMDWGAGRRADASSPAKRFFQRVRDFFREFTGALHGAGLRTASDVFRQVERGAVGARANVDDTGPAGLSPEFMASDSTRMPAHARRTPGPAPRVMFDSTATEARFRAASKGIGSGNSIIASTREWWNHIKDGFARHWINLPNVPEYAELQQKLRILEAAPEAANEEIERIMRGLIGDLSREEFELFRRKVILDDLSWEAAQDHDLPFGLTAAQIPGELAKVDAALAKNPDLLARVRERKLMVRAVANRLVAAGVLGKEQVKNPAYYRHVVLEHAQVMRSASKKKLRTPYWARREGSEKDINANYLEAEFDWLRKALNDIKTADAIAWIKDSKHNIRGRVVAAAKASNDAGVRAAIAADMRRNGFVKNGTMTSPMNERWKGFKQRIAIGFSSVRKELKAGSIPVPPQYIDAADAIENETADENALNFLGWILDNDMPGKMGAATAFKAIAERKAWTKALLGEGYADPTDIKGLVRRGLAPDGYVTWQPEEGKLLYTAKTLPTHVVDKFMRSLATGSHTDAAAMMGLPHDAATAEFARKLMEEITGAAREVLAVGNDKYTMVIPDDVATTLNSLRDVAWDGIFGKIAEVPLRLWKQWVLINPLRVLKYNLNNLSGDLDAVIAGEPKIVTKAPGAARELWNVMVRGATPSADYRAAVERGVFNAGLTLQEIPDIGRLSQFEHLLQPGSQSVLRRAGTPLGKSWRFLRQSTAFRENVLRYAAYQHYLGQLRLGTAMDKIGYGASNPAMVDAVRDPRDRAALLARDLVGDYGNISHFGRGIRRTLVPFWSWTEINAKRYARLGANAYGQGIGKGIAKTGAIGGVLGIRTTAYLGIRMFALYAMIQLWNHLLFGDDEDKLDPDQARQLHLLLGHDAKGEVRSLRMQGALSDFLSWFGFEDAIGAIGEVEKGRGTVTDVLKTVAGAPVAKLVNGVTPLISVPVTMLSGENFYPDIFHPRPVHDRPREVFRLFSLDPAYDWALGKPSRGIGNTLEGALDYKRDPGEIAYDTVKGLAYDWLHRVKGESGVGASETPRSEALREWRLALRYGDDAAARKAVATMRALKMNAADIRQSLARANPLGPIALKDRAAFLRTLTDDERKRLELARKWYQETFRVHGRETLRPDVGR